MLDPSTIQLEETKITDYVEHQEQTLVMPVQQEMLEGDYFDWENLKEVHGWGKIASYNGEEITTEYISTTGELSTGATVYYKLATPTELDFTTEQKAVKEQIKNLHSYKNVTHIFSTDEINANLSIEYYAKNDISYETNEVDRIIGFVDNLEAIRQAIYHILMTERYAYLIYDDNYGVELEQYIGKDLDYIQATIEETLREALTYDLRILDVTVNNIEQIDNSTVLINFTVNTEYGDLILEVNVDV